MKTNIKEFLIPFVGLKIGKHFFDFEINSSFFDAFEYSPIQNGVLNAKLELDKKETMLNEIDDLIQTYNILKKEITVFKKSNDETSP